MEGDINVEEINVLLLGIVLFLFSWLRFLNNGKSSELPLGDEQSKKITTNSKENFSNDFPGTNVGEIDNLILLLKAGQTDDKDYLYPEADEKFSAKLVSWWKMNEDADISAVCDEILSTIRDPNYPEKIFKNVIKYLVIPRTS